MHASGVVHRDIKSDNVLRMTKADDTVVKIADFGLSVRLPGYGSKRHNPKQAARRKKCTVLTEECGTPHYYAPELIAGAYGPVDFCSRKIGFWFLLTT